MPDDEDLNPNTGRVVAEHEPAIRRRGFRTAGGGVINSTTDYIVFECLVEKPRWVQHSYGIRHNADNLEMKFRQGYWTLSNAEGLVASGHWEEFSMDNDLPSSQSDELPGGPW